MRRPIAFCLMAIATILGTVFVVETTAASAERSEVSPPLPLPEKADLPADGWVDVPGTLPNPGVHVAPPFDFMIVEWM